MKDKKNFFFVKRVKTPDLGFISDFFLIRLN